ncbi:MAG: hypothetical protein ACRDV9_10940 [Acidimicrobiia bacterium]
MSELERTLEDLGGRLDYPEASGLSRAVRAGLEAPRSRSALPVPGGRRRLRAGIAMLLVVVSAALVLWSPARQAVARLLGIGGVRITRQDPPAAPLGDGLPLGRELTLEEARSRVTFPLRLPGRELGAPDRVLFDALASGGMVSLVYGPDSRLPEAGASGVGLLLSQFRGRLEAPLLTKFIGPEGSVQEVSVNDGPGYWLSGPGHTVLYRSNAELAEGVLFRAVNVLLWEADGVTLRLESSLSLDAALEFARSLS